MVEETKLCVNCGELVDASYDPDDCPNSNYVWKDVGNDYNQDL